MNNKLTGKLHKDYPEIFPPNRNGYSLGFECNDGWYDLINGLCSTIMMFCKDNNKKPPIASQVKEKYGSLRFYVQSAPVEIYDIIDRFELESQYTCETCGKRGKIYNIKGWYTCLCEEHLIERRGYDDRS
jgi:hypothetical protein